MKNKGKNYEVKKSQEAVDKEIDLGEPESKQEQIEDEQQETKQQETKQNNQPQEKSSIYFDKEKGIVIVTDPVKKGVLSNLIGTLSHTCKEYKKPIEVLLENKFDVKISLSILPKSGEIDKS